MERSIKTRALIVGAGPVGLTLATDLARRGIDALIVESRPRGEPPSVKCNHVAARSMEIFRRLGVVKQVRAAGLPDEYPNDIAYRTAMNGRELTRISIPNRLERYTATGGPDTWWPTPEPPHRINQIFLEPILFEHAAAQPRVTILNCARLDSFEQDDERVTARIRNLDTGAESTVVAEFLIGCDGARSTVRRGIGARLQGDAVIQRAQSSYIRAPKLLSLLTTQPAWGNVSLNPRRSGTVYAIDGRETWLIHNYLRDEEADFDAVDRDWAIRAILGVDGDFDYEVISNEDWFGRRLVSDAFRRGRAFICGDAAHLWVPYAGYGMNAGIADAANLAWLLAANLNGWGTDAILDAHERERLPITEQVSRFAMNHAHAMAKQRRAVPPEIEDETPEGEAARSAVAEAAYTLNVQQYACAGLNFGYYYDRSPIIAYDGAPHPTYSMGAFAPSTVPGCRTHHVWLRDGRSLYDAMGPDYTLLRFDRNTDVARFVDAAGRRGVPLAVLDVESDGGSDVYREKLVLSRPDQHVAWRGNEAPADPVALVDRIRGAAHRADESPTGGMGCHGSLAKRR
ncbi:MAG TPA: FAD-dependent oxidoreductase [Thermomicrobiales bacterium]|nr:FAD-dependent oxidoreductase [Thermomicrobiales bacterium]